MNLARLSPILLIALAPLAAAQPPATGDAPKQAPAPKAAADLGEAMARVLIKADQSALGEVIEGLFQSGKDGRARLRSLLDRVMPAAEALPPMDKGTKPDPKQASEPLNDETKALVEDILGKDAAKAEAAVGKLKDAAKTATDQVRKVTSRTNAIFSSYILRVFREQNDSGAIFAGQYAGFKDLGPLALRTMTTWVVNPPSRTASEGLRIQCIKAVRDLVEGKPDEKLGKALKDIANDEFEDTNVQKEAKYALAQFGDRSFIDPTIKKLEDQVKGSNEDNKGDALAELADIYYQLRDYKGAVQAYKQQIELLEAGKVDRKSVQSVPTLYYNACCSMALAGMSDDAFKFLEKAIDEGRKGGQSLRRKLLEVDMDIESLRKDPRFEKLLEKLGGGAKKKAGTDDGK